MLAPRASLACPLRREALPPPRCVVQNQTLQRKLAEYLRSAKKSDETKEAEKSVTDQEQRYYKCLAQVWHVTVSRWGCATA